MKKFKFLMVFGICLIFCFLLTAGVMGQENTPTVTLPISNLLEVRKDLTRKEGNVFPGGWSEYYADYKVKSEQNIKGSGEDSFDVVVFPHTLELFWIETLMLQSEKFESDEWAEKKFADISNMSSDSLEFQIYLYSDSLEIVAQENLRFLYLDNTGNQEEGYVYDYRQNEFKRPMYGIEVHVEFPFLTNLGDIIWFNLQIINTKKADKVDMLWDFRKD